MRHALAQNFTLKVYALFVLPMKTIASRLLMLRGETKQGQFATMLGLNPNTLRAYETGRAIPNQEILARVCVKFSVNPAWLLLGTGPMHASPPLPNSQEGFKTCYIPKIPPTFPFPDHEDFAAENILAYLAFPKEWLEEKGNPSNMFLMDASGKSMEPVICDNDIVLIDKSRKELFPGKIYAVAFDDMIYLKYIDKLPGKIQFSSANTQYMPISLEYTHEAMPSLNIIGRVLWSGREYE